MIYSLALPSCSLPSSFAPILSFLFLFCSYPLGLSRVREEVIHMLTVHSLHIHSASCTKKVRTTEPANRETGNRESFG